MLSEKEVENIAKLARIELTPAEKKRLQKELSLVLDYAEKLRKVDVAGVEPTFHTAAVKNSLRQDVVFKRAGEQVLKLLNLAPKKKQGHIKVKSVLSKPR